MQRVIDISEEDFEIISMRMKNYNRAIDDEVRIMANAIVNGTPLNEVLDKIRAEIDKRKSTIDKAISEDELKIEGLKEAYTDCLKIIDKYRKEQ